jgi:hypothetical protein
MLVFLARYDIGRFSNHIIHVVVQYMPSPTYNSMHHAVASLVSWCTEEILHLAFTNKDFLLRDTHLIPG